MKYLKLTLIKKLFVVFGFMTLAACDPIENMFPSHCYSLYVLNDTENIVWFHTNFSVNLRGGMYTEGEGIETIMPGDTLFLRKNVGVPKNNTPFATAWDDISDNELYVRIFPFSTETYTEGELWHEWRNTNGFDNSFFEEDSWQLTHWDKDPRDPYNIQHYSWEFSLKKHLP